MNILVAIDFSPVTDSVIAEAEKLGKSSPSKIRLLHVVDPEPDFIGYEPGPQEERDFISEHIHEHRRKLHANAENLQAKGLEVSTQCIQGPIAESILKESQNHPTDIIIMGSHGHSAVYKLIIGGSTEEVLKNTKCPILIVPSKKD